MNIKEALQQTKKFNFNYNPQPLDLKDSQKYQFFADRYEYIEFEYKTDYKGLKASPFDKNRFEMLRDNFDEKNLIAYIDYKAYKFEIPANKPIKVKFINNIKYDKSNEDKEVDQSYVIYTLSGLDKERYFLDNKEYSKEDFSKFLQIHPELQFIEELLLENSNTKNKKIKNKP